jgi:hypothetical protein
MARLRTVLIGLVMLCASVSVAAAQGVQTGTIRGVIRDDQGLAVPGVTITATSPAVQGPRVATSDQTGTYTLVNLPPGTYSIKYELSNFATIERQTTVALGLAVDVSVTMKPAGVTESVQVVAETPAPIATPVVGANVKHEEIEALATPRTIQGIATLAPAVTEFTPNAGQLVINGAFAFDNVFMINGVDINDNLFANPQNLFIEDAIEETQVLTSGISAEYGRFTGGVINAITKSGGNTFSGSFRTNFTNPRWSKVTPFEASKNITNPSNLQESYEGVLGGPIVRDRLWFFTSGRYAPLQIPATVAQSGVQVIQDDKNKRGEVKLTGTVAPNHTIQGGYLNNARTVSNTSGIFTLLADPHSLVTRSLPNAYYYTNYKGVVGNGLLIEAQYSQRTFEFQGDGGTSTNITDSPIFSNSLPFAYNAPYFSANDPEQRNNRQLTANVTKFWAGAGRHQTKGGYEFFRSQRTGGNSQSSTQYVFDSDWATDASGKPLLDSQGRFVPVFTPGVSGVDFFPATVGATLNIDNNSLYVQDHWVVNAKLSADLGARYEHVKALSSGNIVGVDNDRIVPRLALTYDALGNGNHVVHVSFSQYSGRYNEALIGANSPVGNPSDIFSLYQGPTGQGVNFAPGFDVKNYPITPANASVTVPTANIFLDPNTKSPLVSEVQASYGVTINNGKGYAEAAYIYRKTTSLIDDFITRDTGTTHVTLSGIDAGIATNHLFENTDQAHRMFSAMNFLSRYRLSNRWTVNGQYTLGLKDDGNYAGESANRPGSVSLIGDYPEAYTPEAPRFFPDGRLASFERHRLRAWTIYDFGLGRAGDLSVSALLRVDSGQVYSLAQTNVALTSIQRAILVNAGYPDAPGRATLYFDGSRGSQEFNGYGAVDLNLSYNVPVFRSLKPWVKLDVFNVLNNDKLVSFDTTVTQDPKSPLDALGYRTGFIQGPNFGKATSAANFIPPFGGVTGLRTFRMAVGIRF